MPAREAARFLGLSEDEIIRRAKAGDMEYTYPSNIARRVTIPTKAGDRKVTIAEAAKRQGKTVAQIEQEIASGKLTSVYPDRFLHVYLQTKWQYEKCPLIDCGGICQSFKPHDGPQIQCLAEAVSHSQETGAGPLGEAESQSLTEGRLFS
jgi:hypothetical protein